jgi:hypothetical protein
MAPRILENIVAFEFFLGSAANTEGVIFHHLDEIITISLSVQNAS